MEIGVVINFSAEDITPKIKEASENGFHACQLIAWNHAILTDRAAALINEACEKYAVKVSTFWCGWQDEVASQWNFEKGPETLGIVPPAVREGRVAQMKRGSDFAKKIGVDKMATHLGYIPKVMSDPNYLPVVEAVRDIANYCKANGQLFIFETGQETPTTLLRMMMDTGCDNLGINLDPANLILYGKANPVDALLILGPYVRDVHAKDGTYPTDPHKLGKQTPLGQGHVDFPKLIARLKEYGYDGTLIIEREISGPDQARDIMAAKAMLETLI